jgi:hypothetical protein
MTENDDDRDWHPSNSAEAEAWLTYESQWKRANVAKSQFTNTSLIKEIASHAWGSYDQEGWMLIAAIWENPNLTSELIESFDKKSVTLKIDSQYSYWMHRYGVERAWSQSLPRKFTSEFINTKLDVDAASRNAFEIADQFLEQMWHDLAEQKHLDLHYSQEQHDPDFFRPWNVGQTSEQILDFFSPGYDVTWISKEESFNFLYAADEAHDAGRNHFEEGYFWDYLDDGPYSNTNLMFAIGAGLEGNDLDNVKENIYSGYLEEYYSDRWYYGASTDITKDSPWTGIRYRELSAEQQMNLVHNLLTTLKHPFLGRPDGLSFHLLECLTKHNQTPENVKALIVSQLSH